MEQRLATGRDLGSLTFYRYAWASSWLVSAAVQALVFFSISCWQTLKCLNLWPKSRQLHFGLLQTNYDSGSLHTNISDPEKTVFVYV
jgi:hypothetical protein